MSAISDKVTTYDAALTAYTANPSTANLDALIAALQGLINTINTTPAPTSGADPDQTYRNNLEAYRDAAYQYEAKRSSSFLASLEAGGQSATAVKHYQIAVPDFALNKSTSAPGTSFLRLGSFPPDGTATAFPPEFSASVTLANIVGNATSIDAQNLTAETDGGEAQFAGVNDATQFMVGFADDTRYRKADEAGSVTSGAANTDVNTFINKQQQLDRKATRQAETKKLLTKGGWWDHSDGNRITTTSGDKIEVIQGNYKMVVLGRQDPSQPIDLNRMFVTDVSGGHFTEQSASPTPCIKTTEYKKVDGAFTLFQDNGYGNVHTRYGWGDIVDEYQVRKKSTKIGTKDKRTEIDDVTWASKITAQSDVSGTIKSNVEAGDIDGYTKVNGTVQNNTVAHHITTLQTAKAITNINTAANHFNMTVGLQENVNVGLILNLYASAALSLGINATSVNGINNTYDGTKLTATLTESNVKAIETSIQDTGTIIGLMANRLNMNVVRVENQIWCIGNIAAHMRGMTLL